MHDRLVRLFHRGTRRAWMFAAALASLGLVLVVAAHPPGAQPRLARSVKVGLLADRTGA